MKHIIVTGASRGIGFELAQQLSKQHCKVLALSRNIASLVEFGHQNITPLSVDLSTESSLDTVTNFVKNNWKQVDIVIHNAGKLINKPFAETSQKDFIEVYQTNVFGVATLTQKLLPYLNKGSHVIAISSMGGIQGSSKFPGLAAYSSSKGAIITLMELLAEEFKDQDIAFNTLALGAVQTEMLAEAFPGYQAPTKPKEIASYICDFALKGNEFYNGKTLQVSNSTP